MSSDQLIKTGHTITSNVVTGGRVHFGDSYTNNTYNINYDVYSQHSFDVGQGERIGVLASMPGLLGITGAIHQQLKAFADVQGADTSKLFYDASSSVSACRLTLESFRRRLTLLDLSSERATLIKVDKLVILFAHAILLFNDLALLLENSNNGRNTDKERLTRILGRIREQNYAWGLQDFILSNPDEQAARDTVSILDNVASRLLTRQDDLRRRLSAFQDQVQASALGPGDTNAVQSPVPQHPIYLEKPGPSTQTQRLSMTPAEFEQALNESWVYRRNRERMGSMSFRDSISFGWSELSELSLADISVISVIALPIQVSELEYGSWYIDEDNSQEDQNEVAPPQENTEQEVKDAIPTICVSPSSSVSSEDTVHCWPAPSTPDEVKGIPENRHTETSGQIFESALPLGMEKTQSDRFDITRAVPDHQQVLFLCASLFQFSIDSSRREAGFPYLQYEQGEIFDVFAQKGELWLAANQDDPNRTFGWIWERHFVKLSQENSSENAATQEPHSQSDIDSNATNSEPSSKSDNMIETDTYRHLLNFF